MTMVKLVALYREPNDRETFERHYREVHAPLVAKMPGLLKLEVTRFKPLSAMETSPYYLMAEMSFADADALWDAMRSDAGRAAARDLKQFAGSLVNLMWGQTESYGTALL